MKWRVSSSQAAVSGSEFCGLGAGAYRETELAISRTSVSGSGGEHLPAFSARSAASMACDVIARRRIAPASSRSHCAAPLG